MSMRMISDEMHFDTITIRKEKKKNLKSGKL